MGTHSFVRQAEVESLGAPEEATCTGDARAVSLDAQPAHAPSSSTPRNVQLDTATPNAGDQRPSTSIKRKQPDFKPALAAWLNDFECDSAWRNALVDEMRERLVDVLNL